MMNTHPLYPPCLDGIPTKGRDSMMSLFCYPPFLGRCLASDWEGPGRENRVSRDESKTRAQTPRPCKGIHPRILGFWATCTREMGPSVKSNRVDFVDCSTTTPEKWGMLSRVNREVGVDFCPRLVADAQ